MKDFLIVGRGLAATCLMHAFHRAGISFTVIGREEMSSCSLVAAGIWNPVVFKRLTKSWMAGQLVPALLLFYRQCEEVLGKELISEKNILRPFTEKQEEELWKKRSKNELDEFLDPVIYKAEQAPVGSRISGTFGKVLQSGHLDVERFIKQSAVYFSEALVNERFDHSGIYSSGTGWTYSGINYNSIVFCEGWLVKDNPLFNWMPLKPAKGEVLHLDIPGLVLKSEILNQGSFLLEYAEGKFKTGATYEWEELDDSVTEEAKEFLQDQAQKMVGKHYTVIGQAAGVRPSSIDRRPIIGEHPDKKNLYVFNGMGTKGVMLCPYFSNNFVNFYLQKEDLHPEVNLSRFYHLYEKKT